MKSAMHPEAREEFLAAIDYYNEAEPGLGMAFYSEQVRDCPHAAVFGL